MLSGWQFIVAKPFYWSFFFFFFCFEENIFNLQSIHNLSFSSSFFFFSCLSLFFCFCFFCILLIFLLLIKVIYKNNYKQTVILI